MFYRARPGRRFAARRGTARHPDKGRPRALAGPPPRTRLLSRAYVLRSTGYARGTEKNLQFCLLPPAHRRPDWTQAQRGLQAALCGHRAPFFSTTLRRQRIPSPGRGADRDGARRAAGYRPRCAGIKPPGGVRSHLRIDLRSANPGWQVARLEDNLRNAVGRVVTSSRTAFCRSACSRACSTPRSCIASIISDPARRDAALGSPPPWRLLVGRALPARTTRRTSSTLSRAALWAVEASCRRRICFVDQTGVLPHHGGPSAST